MIVTLLTDFGAADYFVGAMKGALLSVNPRATIVDLTHEIPAHDVEAGAFTLLAAYASFPAQTIHVAVVDPGVGSTRRPLLMVCRDQFFVGPDNGLFSYVSEREADCRVYHLTNQKYFREPVSQTFHGRDVFAPVAGALSNKVAPETLGVVIDDQVRLAPLAPRAVSDGTLDAAIIHVDRFGNCVTNITQQELTAEEIAGGFELRVGEYRVHEWRRFFGEETQGGDELFAIWGSAGFLEIAADCASAAERLDARRGQLIRLFKSTRKVAKT